MYLPIKVVWKQKTTLIREHLYDWPHPSLAQIFLSSLLQLGNASPDLKELILIFWYSGMQYIWSLRGYFYNRALSSIYSLPPSHSDPSHLYGPASSSRIVLHPKSHSNITRELARNNRLNIWINYQFYRGIV